MWNSVLDVVALRRDTPSLKKLLRAVPRMGRCCTRGDAEYRYWCRFFDSVHFESCFVMNKSFRIPPRMAVVWRRTGVCHREDGPAIVFDKDTVMWYLHGHPYMIKQGERVECLSRRVE